MLCGVTPENLISELKKMSSHHKYKQNDKDVYTRCVFNM